MTINFGKRAPGSLTAASPGDTLYIPLQFFNDSGASISIGSTLAVTDIELFRNGDTGFRNTDSGYAVLGDTGNFQNRTGFKGISVSLFNTADDTGFYDIGSSYWVAVDSVTVDGRTVRFFPAVFEIDTVDVNVTAFSDTGVQDRLARILSDTDTGIQGGVNVTSIAANAITATAIQDNAITAAKIAADAIGASELAADAAQEIAAAVWDDLDTGHAAGTMGFYHVTDTGPNDRLAKILADTDTGIQSSVNVTTILGDTGSPVHLNRLVDEHDTGRLQAEATATLDTGAVNQAVWQANAERTITNISAAQNTLLAKMANENDTGQLDVAATATLDTGVMNQAVWQADASRVLTGFPHDTGVSDTVWKATSRVLTGFPHDTGVSDTVWKETARTLTAFAHDTGVADTTWKYSSRVLTSFPHDTGVWDSATRSLTAGVNVTQVVGDTGAAEFLASLNDTAGGINVRSIADTGINDRLARILADTDTGIQGGVNVTSIGANVITATSIASNAITSAKVAANTIGATQIATDAITAAKIAANAIGASELAADAANEIAAAVWDDLDTGHAAGRMGYYLVTDTGPNDRLGKILADTDTGIQSSVNVTSIRGDTGAAEFLSSLNDTGGGINVTSIADTGLNNRLDVILSDTDTGIQSSVTVTGLSDTGINDRLAKILADTDTGINVPTAYQNADALLNFDMAEATDSGTEARRTVLQALRFNRNRVEFDTGAVSIYKEDDSTVSHTGSLERDTGAAPIKTVNPT